MAGLKLDEFFAALSEGKKYGLNGKEAFKFAWSGFSDSDMSALRNYNELVSNGTEYTDAINQALGNASMAARRAALEANGNTVALKSQSAATKAATNATKLLKGALSMLGNIAITWAITTIIELYEEWEHSAENARKALQELYDDSSNTVNEIQNQNKTIDKIVNSYKEYEDVLSLTFQQKDELRDIQKEYLEAIGKEIDGLDLVNGKYEENIELMRKQRATKASKDLLSSKNELSSAQDIYSSYKGYTIAEGKGQISKAIWDELKQVGVDIVRTPDNTPDDIFYDLKLPGWEDRDYYTRYTIQAKNSRELRDKLLEVEKILGEYNNKSHKDLKIDNSILTKLRQEISDRTKEVDAYNNSYLDVAKDYITEFYTDIDGVTYYYDNVTLDIYKTWIDQLLEKYAKNDTLMQNAIKEVLNQLNTDPLMRSVVDWGSPAYYEGVEQVGNIVPESIVTFNDQFDEEINSLREKRDEYQNILKTLSEDPNADLTEFYQKNVDFAQFDTDRSKLQTEILKANGSAIDELTKKLKEYKDLLLDEKGLPIEEDQKKVEAIISQIESWKYLDNIDDAVKQVVDDFGTLKDAADKLLEGDYESSDLQSLFESFPELQQYAGDIEQLAAKAKELGETKATDMLMFLTSLKETVTDPEVIKALEAQITILQRLNYTSRSWLEYETGKIDDIIEGLEEENDKLQEQLDIVEEMISKYKTASDTMQKYIDDKVKALEDEKQAIEDDYDAQIKAIEDKNKEREQEINLQEKLDALLNAKKKRVNVYSETNGWKLQRNSSDIAEKQREYDQAVDEKKIADIEKKRDAKTAAYDEKIKEWNNYSERLSEKIDKIESVADEKTTAEILGHDWRERLNNKDNNILDTFIKNYDVYLNKKKPQLEKEKADNDTRIKFYQDLKKEMEDAVNSAKTKNDEYLDSLEKVRLGEITNYAQREAYLKSFLQTQDDLLKNSNYGKMMLDGHDPTLDSIITNGAEVVFSGKDLLSNTSTSSMIDKMKFLETKQGRIVQDVVNATNTAINKYDKRTNSNNFQFFGDIKTENPEQFMTMMQRFVKQSGLEAVIGK